MIDRHLRGLEQLDADGVAVDIPLARAAARALHAMVDHTAAGSAVDRARVRVAVHYFVLRRDADDDRGPTGLRDDVDVINQAAADLGRPDLGVR